MRTTRLIAAALAASAALLAAPAVAWGHAEFEAEGPVVQGGYATLTLTVPNEKADAATVEVAMQMPADTPIALVAPEAPEGWEVSTTSRDLAAPIVVDGVTISSVVDVITWTTSTAKLGPGEVKGTFSLTMGPFPLGVDSVSFPTVQGYDNGDRVRWIEPPLAGGGEPEFPLPTVEVGAGTGAIEPIPDSLRAAATAAAITTTQAPAPSTEAPTTTAAPAVTDAPVATIEAVTSAPDTTPEVIAPAPTTADSGDDGGSSTGVVIGAVAVVAVVAGAVVALRRRRRAGTA